MKTVLGIGNALVDILIKLDNDEFLSEFGLQRGSMTLVDKQKMNAVLQKSTTENLEMNKSSGGSVANAIHGMAQLGTPAGYIGKIGHDSYGKFFQSYMEQNNICATLFEGKEDSGKSMVMVSKDSERTFATYLGAAVELDASDLTAGPFKGYEYFLLEGYLVQNYPLVERAVQLAKEAGCRIAIDLASYNIVADNLEFLKSIVGQYVDIVFANEEESKAFTGKDDPRKALDDIADVCSIAVVKVGKDGSLIKSDDVVYEISPVPANCIDTTGAGDLFASGFFYGLTCGQPLDICGKIGSIVSGKIIEVVGAKMSTEKWNDAKELIKQILV
jgi:sugar/nucleoside kinase (ribokinase family)